MWARCVLAACITNRWTRTFRGNGALFKFCRWSTDLLEAEQRPLQPPSSTGDEEASSEAAMHSDQGRGPGPEDREADCSPVASSSSAGALSTLEPHGQDRQHAEQKWMFTSQQMRLSIEQMDVYNMHLAAAEEIDEDFSGNFS